VKNVRIDKKTGRRIRTLPTLLVALRGEVSLNLRATTNVKNGKLVNTFGTVPDAPVSRFELSLKSGSKGILTVNGNLCRHKQVTELDMAGHNNKRADANLTMKVPCGKGSKRK
jgi:hypothetical protein